MLRDDQEIENTDVAVSDRRKFLENCGKFAATLPPAMTVLMSTSLVSPAIAQSAGISRKGNNGLGNGSDPQPWGNPPVNDGVGTFPGHPGNQGLGKRK